MAYDDTDPFSGPTMQNPVGDIMGEWSAALDNPKVRAVLLQTGLSLMSPMPAGQTNLGHLAGAIGEGGEALARGNKEDRDVEALDIKRSEADSRATDRIDKANNAEYRLRLTEQDNESKRAVRSATIRTKEAQARQYDARVQMLEQQAAAFPGSQEIKNELAAARAEQARANADWLDARRELAPGDQEIKRQNADSRSQDSETRRGGLGIRERDLDRKTGADFISQVNAAQRVYNAEIAEIRKQNEGLIGNKVPKKEMPDRQEWMRRNYPDLARRMYGESAPTQAPSTTAAPIASPMSVPNLGEDRERELALSNIQKNPAREQEIRALYRKRTGKDL